jgi:hypothetical protein
MPDMLRAVEHFVSSGLRVSSISHSFFVIALRPNAKCIPIPLQDCDQAVTKIVDIRILQSTNQRD